MKKKITAAILAAAMAVSLTACGSKRVDISEIPQLSPDQVLTVEAAAQSNGGTMTMSDEGIINDGKQLSLTYVGVPLGSVDTISVAIEQFSTSVTASQVWNDYETDRLKRADAQFIDGIGQDCYIAFPYICVFTRGCYIKISAGSGNNDTQKQVLIGLAAQAASGVEALITPEQAEAAAENVIQ